MQEYRKAPFRKYHNYGYSLLCIVRKNKVEIVSILSLFYEIIYNNQKKPYENENGKKRFRKISKKLLHIAFECGILYSASKKAVNISPKNTTKTKSEISTATVLDYYIKECFR